MMDRDDVLSKHILLVIIAAVIVIGIINIVIFSIQPAQEKTLRFNATVELSGKTVYLYHDGATRLVKERSSSA
jgi:hypothetical protein